MSAAPDLPIEIQSALDSLGDKSIQTTLMKLREMVFETAESSGSIGQLSETLKWGQPSYAPAKPKTGTTLRLWRDKSGSHPALFVPCSTTLVQEFRDIHGDTLECDGNRGLILTNGLVNQEHVVRQFISSALTYHLRKRNHSSTANRRSSK